MAAEHRTTERFSDICWSVFVQSGICIAHLDPRLRISAANGPFCSHIGSSPADVLGHLPGGPSGVPVRFGSVRGDTPP
ncbi:hypothetical protein ACWDE9_32165, partial [Streptomyces olivaceoviridis]